MLLPSQSSASAHPLPHLSRPGSRAARAAPPRCQARQHQPPTSRTRKISHRCRKHTEFRLICGVLGETPANSRTPDITRDLLEILRLTASRRRQCGARATCDLLSDAVAFGLPLNALVAAIPRLEESALADLRRSGQPPGPKANVPNLLRSAIINGTNGHLTCLGNG
jgi:hypothetical protein